MAEIPDLTMLGFFKFKNNKTPGNILQKEFIPINKKDMTSISSSCLQYLYCVNPQY